MKKIKTKTSKAVWDILYAAIPNAYAVAGMMGNLYFESMMDPMAVEGFSIADAKKYTEGVDTGRISMRKFVLDGVGYGLGRWSEWTRKQDIYNMAKKAGKSVGDAELQAEFIVDELNGVTYAPVLKEMKKARHVELITHYISDKYMNKNGTAEDLYLKLDYARAFYNTYGVDSDTDSHISPDKKKEKEEEKYQVRVTKNTYIRKEPNGKSEPLFYVTEGVTLDILGMNDKKNYYHVCTISITNSIPSIASRVTGWIYKNYCKLI